MKPGDTVDAEDPLITLECDKATMDVPAPQAGTVAELRVKLGDRVSQGSVILLLEAEGAAAGQAEGKRPRGRRARAGDSGQLRLAERRLRNDRRRRPRHRRLQGRAGHRGARQPSARA